jgi:hypothetical protein
MFCSNFDIILNEGEIVNKVALKTDVSVCSWHEEHLTVVPE